MYTRLYDVPFHTGSLASLTFLVTGGAGFIGSHLVEYLLCHGARRVRVLDNLSTGSYQNIAAFASSSAFEFVEGDIRNYESCRQACEGIDIVLHQAALGSVPRSVQLPLDTHAVNVDGFVNMLWAAQQAGVRRFIFASSSSVYGDSLQIPKKEEYIGKPLSPYALSKRINEQYADVFARTYGLNYVGLRYFNVFGPRQSPEGPYAAVVPLFMQAALFQQPPTIHGDGQQSRDFTFVSNAVQANIKAALIEDSQALNQVYNVACGQQISVNELWWHIARLTGCSLQPRYSSPRAGDIRHSLADITRIQMQLGYQPQYSIQEGLQHSLLWYKQHVQKKV